MKRTVICIALAVAVCLGAAWTAPRAGAVAGPAEGAAAGQVAAGGASAPAQAPPVAMRIVQVRGVTAVAGGHASATRETAARAAAMPRGALAAAAAAAARPTLDSGMRFTLAGVVCAVPTTRGTVMIRLRTSLDGQTWSRWYAAPLEVAAEAWGAPRAFCEPIWTGPARYAQVRAVADGTGAPATLAHVRLVALDPEVVPADAHVAARAEVVAGPPALTGASATAAAWTSKAVSPVVKAVAPARAAAPLRIVTRKLWGANETMRGAAPQYARVRMIFVHHTDTGNDYTPDEAPGIVRAIYAYHTRALGWSDIGYNFLVDRFGTIYEGRYGGIKRGVIGAQVLGFNTHSCGISVMGTFMTDAPPAEALASLERLITWKLKLNHVNPLGTATMLCDATEKFRAGERVRFPVIAGHRQANFTDCPGNVLFPLLQTVRLEADGQPQPPIVSLVKASPTPFSPNGDGVLDTTTLQLWLTKAAAWTIELQDAAGQRVGSFSGEGTSGEATWRGLHADGTAFPDGTYTAVVTATNDLGTSAPKKATLVIDTVPPVLSGADVQPMTFSPNGDGWADTAKLRYTPAEACAVRVSILDASGTVVRRLSDWQNQTAGPHTVTWDGYMVAGGDPANDTDLVSAPEGQYRFLVECRDAAGNVSHAEVAVTVDRTVGFPAAVPETFSPNGDGVQDTTTLGFQLTRPASVRVAVKVGGKAVRTFQLGQLAAGPQSVTWDGTDDAGAPVGSCRARFTVTATSELGSVSATGDVIVDLEQPALSAVPAQTVVFGKSAQLSCTAVDAFSDQVELSYAITDASGATVAAASRGWVPTGEAAAWAWKPPAPGVYTVTFTAVDLGGNREQAPAVTVLTVQ